MNVSNAFREPRHIGGLIDQIMADAGISIPAEPKSEPRAETQMALTGFSSDNEVTRQAFETGVRTVPKRKWR